MRRARADGYEIDDDPGRVDAGAAVKFLTTEAYWGRERSAGQIRHQIASAWRVAGAYDAAGTMVGFARAFSDGATAYLADVYVLAAHRRAGLGTGIVRAMIDDGPGAGFRWMLHTADAHGLYRKFGFTAPYTGRYLERPEGGQAGESARARAAGAAKPLTGRHVRLEPLAHRHIPGLVAAARRSASLYRWARVPQDGASMRSYVEAALADRDKEATVPFAVTRAADGTVIGCTRFADLGYWAPPDRVPGTAQSPSTCEIGPAWLSESAIRTGASTDMNQLMLTHAFETWRVRSVCLLADARDERSRAAVSRTGATFEGILRAHRPGADGLPGDSARYSITAGEWPAVRRHLDDLLRRYSDSA